METFADTLFDTDCALPYLPSYLEIRREHQLIKQNPGEVLGKQELQRETFEQFKWILFVVYPEGTSLISRCVDPNQSLKGEYLQDYGHRNLTVLAHLKL